jgi:DNA-directed RNA polymerase sigma subunit (sigma70/sigma32)
MTIETIEMCRTAHGLEPVSMHHGIQGTDLVLYESAVFGTTQSAEDEYLESVEEGSAMDHLSRLDDETRQMVVLHLGLDGRVPQTIHMIASRYRLPPVIAKQRLAEAIAELRKNIETSRG